MILLHIVLATCVCLSSVKTETTISSEDEETTIALEPVEDEDVIQQSVALIDIVFTDGKKRTCSGAIIHDYVVITCGHCLFIVKQSTLLKLLLDHNLYDCVRDMLSVIYYEIASGYPTKIQNTAILYNALVIAKKWFVGIADGQPNVPPELTASFVVIGTRNKFEAGYEQYLPIERVITNPNMQGWKSDLALIHTFASMTANKIGAVIPLANDRSYGPGDGNFTILSWGRVMGGQEEESEQETTAEESNSCEIDYNNPEPDSYEPKKDHFVGYNYGKFKGIDSKDSTIPIHIQREGKPHQENSKGPHQKKMHENHPTTNKVSRYLSSHENINPQKPPVSASRHRYHKTHRNLTAINKGDYIKENNMEGIALNVQRGPEDNAKDDTRRTRDIESKSLQSNQPIMRKRAHSHKRGIQRKTKPSWGANWRRQMGTKEANKLTVESFGFIGNQPCKKMVNKIVPHMHLNSSEIICYESDDHYVTDEDSGAPAIRQGELVAITVGGIVSEGNHVAVGIKLSEYCAWMSENLPAGTETNLNCWSHHGPGAAHESDEIDKEDKRSKRQSNFNRYLG